MNPYQVFSRILFVTGLMSLFVVQGCASKKSLTGNISGNHSNVDATMEALAATQVPYEWFSGSGQGRIDWDGERYSVRFNVRIRQDSVIWMVITKLGFEVGRMYVTPDSAFFINRLDHSYSIYKTEAFLKEYNVPAEFNMFSRVFTAGAYIPEPVTEVMKGDTGSIVLMGKSGIKAEHWLEGIQLLKSQITDASDHVWTAGFSAYQQTDTGQQFPYVRSNRIVIEGVTNFFDLEYSSVSIDIPQDFPFSIPSHYEKE